MAKGDKLDSSDFYSSGSLEPLIRDLEKVGASSENILSIFSKLKQAVSEAGSGIASSLSGNGGGNSYKDITKQLADIERLKKATQDLNKLKIEEAKTEIAYQKQLQETSKTEREEIRLKEAKIKFTNQEQKFVKDVTSEYARQSKLLNELRKEYKDLALTQGVNSQAAQNLLNRIKPLDEALKAVDASVGQHQRNVGNYESAWNGLGNAMNQLAREAPAFANSLQTGFMAISNNLPALIDEIGKINKQNKELASQGKQTTSVLSQIATNFLSLNMALNLGILALTAYGDDLVKWIEKVINGTKALIGIKEANEAFNKTMEDSNKNVTDSILDLAVANGTLLVSEANLQKVRNQRSDKEKEEAERNKKTIEDLMKQNEITEQMIKNVDKFTERLEVGRGGESKLTRDYMLSPSDREKVKLFLKEQERLKLDHESLLLNIKIEYDNKEKAAQIAVDKEKGKLNEKANKDDESEEKKHQDRLNELAKKAMKDRFEAIQEERKKHTDFLESQNNKDATLNGETPEDTSKFEAEMKKRSDALRANETRRLEILKEGINKQVQLENDRYAEERQKAEENGEDLALIEEKHQQRIRQIQQSYTKKMTDEIASATEKAYKLKNDAKTAEINNEIKMAEKQLSIQAQLAAGGQDNKLAEAEARYDAKLLKQEQQRKAEIKQQKILSMWNMIASYSKNDPDSAVVKAATQQALAEIIVNGLPGFYEGTGDHKNVADALGMPHLNRARDQYIIAADGREKILNPEQSALTGDLTANQITDITNRYLTGKLFDDRKISVETTDSMVVAAIFERKIDQLIKSIEEKPVSSVNIDELGRITESLKSKNKEVKTVYSGYSGF